MSHSTVSDVMTRPVLTVHEDAPFKDVARVLTERRISALPVTDRRGRVVGVVSQADLLRKAEYQEGSPHRLDLTRPARRERARAEGETARDLMTAPPVTVTPDTGVSAAARLMAARKVGRLPVVDDAGVAVGVVSRADLLRVFVRPDETIRQDVLGRVFRRALWADPDEFPVSVRDGVVTLRGEVEQRSLVPVVVRLARAVDGVVDIVDELTYAVDDTRVRAWSDRSVDRAF